VKPHGTHHHADATDGCRGKATKRSDLRRGSVNADEQLALLWEGKANRIWQEHVERHRGAFASMLLAFPTNVATKIMPLLHDLFVAGFVRGARFERERNAVSSDDSYRKDGGA
jgi:hypothetical protein